MDNLETKILQTILNENNVDTDTILSVFDISKRQLNYRLNNINTYLKNQNMPGIVRNKRGFFEIHPELHINISKRHAPLATIQMALSDEEQRLYRLFLHIVCNFDYLSADDLAFHLNISKNSVLLDIKQLRLILENKDLSLEYNRKSGYVINGSEFIIREEIFNVIDSNIHSESKYSEICAITRTSEAETFRAFSLLTNVEKTCGYRFADEKLKLLSLFIPIMLNRIDNSFTLNSLPYNYEYISNTIEYDSLIDEFNLSSYTNEDIEYIVSKILISNKIMYDTSIKDIRKETMRNDILEVIYNFQHVLAIVVSDDSLEEFIESIYLHWIPAMNRINLGTHVKNVLHDSVIENYRYIYANTRSIIQPFVKYLNNPIPDEEISLFTIIFGGWLKRFSNSTATKKPRAFVVCQSGLSISYLVYNHLVKLFPEFEFIDHVSLREFQNTKIMYDIVFATTEVSSDAHVYYISSIFSEQYQINLRRIVMWDFFKIEEHSVKVNQVIDVIEIYVSKNDIAIIERELTELFYPNVTIRENAKLKNKNIYDFMHAHHIRVMNENTEKDWKKIIHIASEQLLVDEVIDTNYIHKMIQIIDQRQPFIQIAKDTIIAHASIHDGVYNVGFSILVLPEEITFANYVNARIIIVLASPNRDDHLVALNQLYKYIISDNNREWLLQEPAPVMIYQDIKNKTDKKEVRITI
ncbi:BglG family transcription antiterminator [Erysipelothrix sp. HDW6A]|uniref:BglG family transcription antiterminator n=1 Tax=Erysipelothrix sp. HDW6A TaxID=2714928 RepID=UPI0014084657|nr:BglG family transcription antiterminator [Erysipelothrix sp. HDW6A]QIK56914.1 BglG family transcription antiterminator [Erysipelothrix sp. HDW6A]